MHKLINYEELRKKGKLKDKLQIDNRTEVSIGDYDFPKNERLLLKDTYSIKNILNSLQYKLDIDTLNLFNIGIDTIKKVYGCTSVDGGHYLFADTILQLAKQYGINPYLFIDEQFYAERDGILLYKIVLKAYEIYDNLDDFYIDFCQIDAGEPVPLQTLYRLFHGSRNSLGATKLSTLLRLCRTVHIPIEDLFRPFKVRGFTSAFTKMGTILQGTSDVDIITAMGFLRLIKGKKCKEIDTSAIKALLEWRDSNNGRG